MAVREVIAWAMVAMFAAVSVFYAQSLGEAGLSAPPNKLATIVATFALIVVVLLESAVAVFAPRLSSGPPDERERLIVARAGHWAGLAFLFGVVPALGNYVVQRDGDIMFNVIVIALIISGLIEYGSQIVLFRR